MAAAFSRLLVPRARDAWRFARGISTMQTSHDSPSTESTTLVSPATLARRQQTWEMLRRESATLLWLPRLCDLAMNHFPRAGNVAEICNSPDFARLCAAHPYPYADLAVTSASALAALSDPARPLFHRYIRSQFLRLSTCTSFDHEQERHDANEMLEDKFFALVERYKVGGFNGDGALVSYGWEAFLSERLVWSVGSRLRTLGFRVHEDIEGDAGRGLADQSTEPVGRADLAAIREVVRRVLTEEIDTPLAEATYRALVYRGESYEEIAARHGCSPSSIGNRSSAPLIARLQEVLRKVGFCGRGKVSFRRLRGPLAETVPEADFDVLMATGLPPPLPTPNRIPPAIIALKRNDRDHSRLAFRHPCHPGLQCCERAAGSRKAA